MHTSYDTNTALENKSNKVKIFLTLEIRLAKHAILESDAWSCERSKLSLTYLRNSRLNELW
jgi:hypothetical protein